jgi:hypothetical protein
MASFGVPDVADVPATVMPMLGNPPIDHRLSQGHRTDDGGVRSWPRAAAIGHSSPRRIDPVLPCRLLQETLPHQRTQLREQPPLPGGRAAGDRRQSSAACEFRHLP